MSDPLQSGLAAGQAAYSGAAPQKRMGISAADLSGLQKSVTSGLSDAAAQRQVLATNAAKQTAGQYPTSGTSAAMYNYMRGQGGYPVNAVPSGQPVNTGTTGYGGAATQVLPTTTKTPTTIQKPYETTVNVGTPTQTTLTNTAKNSPTKMGTVSQPTVNMPKPSLVNQLLATAGPMYLGYTLLDKSGGLSALGKGWDSLFGGSSGLPAGVDASSTQALIDQYYTNPSIDLASAGSEDALQILADREAARVAAEQAAAQAAAASTTDAGIAGAGNVLTDGGAGDLTAGTLAGGYTGDAGATAGLTEAAGAGATAGGAGLTDLAGNAGYDTTAMTAGDAGAAALSEEEAAALAEANGLDWAAMTAEFGPYVAAAIIADQLTGGHIAKGVGDVVQSAGDVVGGVLQGAGDVVTGFFGGIGDLFAEGGQVKRYADGGISAAQGISVGSRPSFEEGGISQAMPETTIEPTVGRFAAGGISHLGGYSDGGRLLRGPGDGVSDSIPATIGNKQPARLADGEFVVPARIVSELGNGSTEAGARKLYAMMDRVQKARGKTVGKGKVAKNTRADKYLPG